MDNNYIVVINMNFFDIPTKLREYLLELQKFSPCHASKEALKWRINDVFGQKIQIFIIL